MRRTPRHVLVRGRWKVRVLVGHVLLRVGMLRISYVCRQRT
jgi:hypothetical protein